MAALVFDLDGTLIDSVPDIAAALNKVFINEGQAPFTQAEVTSFIGHGLPSLVRKAMMARGMELTAHEALSTKVQAEYQADSSSRTRLYPHVRETLERLQSAGHRLGLCTNKPETAALLILQDLNLARYFDKVIGGTEGRLKPDPAPLHETFAALGNGPRLYIGDSEVDAQTAKAAAIPFLLFTEGYRKSGIADLPHLATFNDFNDLIDLIEKSLTLDIA